MTSSSPPSAAHSKLLARASSCWTPSARRTVTVKAQSGAPVMVAHLTQQGNSLVEQRRGFVVPDQWSAQAAERRRSGALPV